MTTHAFYPAHTITLGMRIHWQGRDLLVVDARQSGARWSLMLQDGQHPSAPWDAELPIVRGAA